uniref:Fibronectin type-III domain-containing protein n=1 Tax=Eptatretus burgeri TaxID=7764 RepID=A0A8C4QYX4_EPTBU
MPDGVSSITLKGLKDDTIYKVDVRAYNTGGSGPPSAACNITTRKARESSSTELITLISICIYIQYNIA